MLLPGSFGFSDSDQYQGRVEPRSADLLEWRIQAAADGEIGAFEKTGAGIVEETFHRSEIWARRNERQARAIEQHHAASR